MVEPLAIISFSLSALQKAWSAYKKITQLIKEWKMAEEDLIKLWIQFEVGWAQASGVLDQLATVPVDDQNTSSEAHEKQLELRQACVDVLTKQMEQATQRMEKLLEETGIAKVAWVSHTRNSLSKDVEELRKWVDEAERVCKIKVKFLRHTVAHDVSNPPSAQPTIEALTGLAMAQKKPSTAEDIYIPGSQLLFEEKEELQPKSKDLSSLLKTFKREAKHLKLLSRRFGVWNHPSGSAEQVMVEFIPYNKNLPQTQPGHYAQTKEHALTLAQMLHSAANHTSTTELPLVPFVGYSELQETNPPCFLLVYRGDDLEPLFSVIKMWPESSTPPSVDARLQLAVTLAKAVFWLHQVGYVHGGLCTDNIFLRQRREGDSMVPLIAGFEIARPAGGHTDKLNVEDRDRSLYVHPRRVVDGYGKDINSAPYDICSLGVVLLEIGLWKPLRHLKGMKSASQNSRREKLYKTTDNLSAKMGSGYMNAVKYCLQGYVDGASAPAGSAGTAARNQSFDTPNAAELITLLEPLLPPPIQ